EGSQNAEPGLQPRACNLDAGKRFRERSLLERPPRGFGGLIRGLAAVQDGGRFGRENLLRFVQVLPLERGKACDLVERQLGEQLEQTADVAVLAIAPELPV